MGFIEGLFGIAPDGGSGALETVLLVVTPVILISIRFYLVAWSTNVPGNERRQGSIQ
jgi:hypothetical protein